MPKRKIDKELLRRLCANEELSDVDIAERFGCTREAIRYARNRLGIEGRGWERLRRHERERKLESMYKQNPLLEKIAAEAEQRGIAFEPLMHSRSGRWMRIGNRVCYQVKSTLRQGRDPQNYYVSLRRPVAHYPYDFLVVTFSLGWLVLPPERLPRKQTMFAVGRKKRKPGATSHQHHWENYYYADWEWMEMMRASDTPQEAAVGS